MYVLIIWVKQVGINKCLLFSHSALMTAALISGLETVQNMKNFLFVVRNNFSLLQTS